MQLGFVVLIDLKTGKQANRVDVGEHVTGIELLQDNGQSFLYALVRAW